MSLPSAPGTTILGVNAYHGDSSACLLVDGEIVAAAEEERFRRKKHWAGFPERSIRWCIESAGIAPDRVDHVALNRDPRANLLRKVVYAVRRRPQLRAVVDRMRNSSNIRRIRECIAEALDLAPNRMRARLHLVEHHRAHLASAFLVSPFQRAATLSVDGFGDFSSTMWGLGDGTEITVLGRVVFPHSLGLYYLALTQYLGFLRYGDEYKVMGLAAYGEPRFVDALRTVVRVTDKGAFELGLRHFLHHSEGVAMSWNDGEPTLGRTFSDALTDLLGPKREPGAPLEQRHKDLAASVQAVYEEVFFHSLGHLYRETGEAHLCLAGGCAMNSLANGRIRERSEFREVYVQAAPGDAGGAIGAAAHVWHQELGQPRRFVMEHAYLGPRFGDDEVASLLDERASELAAAGCTRERVGDFEELCRRVAARIAEGDVIGWFQGRMEWGPRALGNRSILGDPRRADMKDVLNRKIKRRESFRPFAPSVLGEATRDWFEEDGPVPFMSQVAVVHEARRATIPAVTHADGTGRLQTVERASNPRYHRLIEAFRDITGVPILLNTSFNENEPIVCHPLEALDCFLRTRMDVLVLGNHLLERAPNADAHE